MFAVVKVVGAFDEVVAVVVAVGVLLEFVVVVVVFVVGVDDMIVVVVVVVLVLAIVVDGNVFALVVVEVLVAWRSFVLDSTPDELLFAAAFEVFILLFVLALTGLIEILESIDLLAIEETVADSPLAESMFSSTFQECAYELPNELP